MYLFCLNLLLFSIWHCRGSVEQHILQTICPASTPDRKVELITKLPETGVVAKYENGNGNEKVEKVFQTTVDAVNWLATRGVQENSVSWTALQPFLFRKLLTKLHSGKNMGTPHSKFRIDTCHVSPCLQSICT